MKCSNNKCTNPANIVVVYNNAQRTATLKPLERIKAGHMVYLCATHAKNLVVPGGWQIINDIDEIDELAAKEQTFAVTEPENESESSEPIIIDITGKRFQNDDYATGNANENVKTSLFPSIPPSDTIKAVGSQDNTSNDADMTVIMRQVSQDKVKNPTMKPVKNTQSEPKFNAHHIKKVSIPNSLVSERRGHLMSLKNGNTQTNLTIISNPNLKSQEGTLDDND